MTEIEQKIIDFIVEYYSKALFYPNYGEIATAIGKSSKSTIHTYMSNLENEGIIIRKDKKSPQYRLANMDYILKNRKENVNG